jgi:hypothetical protein
MDEVDVGHDYQTIALTMVPELNEAYRMNSYDPGFKCGLIDVIVTDK